MSIYRRGFPLLDKELQETLSTTRNEVDVISKALGGQAFTGTESKYDVLDLVSARDNFKSRLIDALQKQLAVLFVHSKR